MQAVGEDRDRAGGQAERDLGGGDGQVEHQHAAQHAGDLREAAGAGQGGRREVRMGRVGQKTRAWGTGHHRTWTLPMMYFFGTMPQWRLSELLFRWSPMTK